MNELTVEVLDKELASWAQENGSGRDKYDLRFGQWICNRYNLTAADAFYAEDPGEAYEFLKELL